MNVPIGLLAAGGFITFLHENAAHGRRSIDFAGATLFMVAVASLLIALTEAGTSGNTQGVTVTVAIFCLSAALTEGLGWQAGATVAARTFPRFGLRQTLISGAVWLPAGASIFVCLTPRSSPVVAALGSLVMGFGMGLISVSSLVLIQELVDWSQRASVTASNVFARNLGSTLGATVLGAMLNYGLAHVSGGIAVTSNQLRQLLEAPRYNVTSIVAIAQALEQSLSFTFRAMLVISLATVFLAIIVSPVEIRRQVAKAPAE
jgi:hypothetical protein